MATNIEWIDVIVSNDNRRRRRRSRRRMERRNKMFDYHRPLLLTRYIIKPIENVSISI